MMCGIERTTELAGFEHLALLYGDLGEYLAGTCRFIEQGLSAGEPVMVAVPGPKIEALRAALNGSAGTIRFVDMGELGRNPGRIIPEVRDWVERERAPRAWFVGEPIWTGRTREETVEATRHEALINLAFAGAAVNILCPYDASALDREVLRDSERTHPQMICGDVVRPSQCYTDPLEIWRAATWLLPEPEQPPACLQIGPDLAAMRRFTARLGRDAGVSEARLDDLILAVDEAATNALRHGRQPARLRIWCLGPRLVCEISDCGRLEEPLAGRRRPGADWPDGRGLWLINQLCDLVELRPMRGATTIRLHVERQSS